MLAFQLLLLDKPVQQFTTKIILLLPNEDPELKRLTFVLLSELSSQTVYRDSLLLSISPLHKQMLSNKTVLRGKYFKFKENQLGDALKTLSHLDIPEISTLLFAGFNKIMGDKSGYVRKYSFFSFLMRALFICFIIELGLMLCINCR